VLPSPGIKLGVGEKVISKRFVRVDTGYGQNECWERAEVVSSRMCNNLFDSGKSESLWVQLPSGERLWVDFWKELDATL
jgi:hypothetical protein